MSSIGYNDQLLKMVKVSAANICPDLKRVYTIKYLLHVLSDKDLHFIWKTLLDYTFMGGLN